MTPNERRNFREQRDHRYNRAWWAFFLLGCLAAFVGADIADEFPVTRWLILSGLVGMILGPKSRSHARRIAQADAFEDLQATRAEATKAAMDREAKQAARQRTQPGRDDEQARQRLERAPPTSSPPP